MQRINEAFYRYLTDRMPEGVEVFPQVADESAQYPFGVIRMDAFEVSKAKACAAKSYLFTYTVSLWGNTFNQVDRIATHLMARVGISDEIRFDGPAGRLRVALSRGESDVGEEGFAQHLTFELKYDGDVA